MKTTQFLTTIYFVVWSLGAQAEVSEEAVLRFFTEYQELSDAFDARIKKLYADDAMVKFSRTLATGGVQRMEFTGVQWKKLLPEMIPISKKLGDISRYSNVRVTLDGAQARIDADRYSEVGCYTDTGYYIVVGESGDGDLLINEEYAETIQESKC